MNPGKVLLRCLLLLAFLAAVVLAAVCFGSAEIGPMEVIRTLGNGLKGVKTLRPHGIIILSIRFPRIIMAGLIGAALAVTGGVFQALLRNPLADPYVLGISSGAAVGAVIVIISGRATAGWYIPLSSFLGALLTILLVFYVAGAREKIRTDTLLLAGVIINSFFSAVIMFLLSTANSHDMQGIIYWLMGDLGRADYHKIALVSPYILLGMTALYFYTPKINLLLLGEEETLRLGVEVERTKKSLYLLASLVTGAAVSVCGIIGFVGLIIPHMVRLVWGNDYRLLMPVSMLSGASFLIIADTAARSVISPSELPVGVVTAIFGTPFFIYLLRTRKTV